MDLKSIFASCEHLVKWFCERERCQRLRSSPEKAREGRERNLFWLISRLQAPSGGEVSAWVGVWDFTHPSHVASRLEISSARWPWGWARRPWCPRGEAAGQPWAPRSTQRPRGRHLPDKMVTRVVAPCYEATEPSTSEWCQVWRQVDEKKGGWTPMGEITFLAPLPWSWSAPLRYPLLQMWSRPTPFNSYLCHWECRAERELKLKIAVDKRCWIGFPLWMGDRQMIKTAVRGHFHPSTPSSTHFQTFPGISNHIVHWLKP